MFLSYLFITSNKHWENACGSEDVEKNNTNSGKD